MLFVQTLINTLIFVDLGRQIISPRPELRAESQDSLT
jgi:hypothetical protein